MVVFLLEYPAIDVSTNDDIYYGEKITLFFVNQK